MAGGLGGRAGGDGGGGGEAKTGGDLGAETDGGKISKLSEIQKTFGEVQTDVIKLCNKADGDETGCLIAEVIDSKLQPEQD